LEARQHLEILASEMSQENVERIEAVFETLLLGTHHGNESIRLIYEENQKTLSGYDVVPVELIDAGDRVVAGPKPSKPPGCRSS
jgi:hypothetical protein